MLENRNVMASNIKRYLKESGKSRHEACKAIGVPYSTFSEWINGNKYPRIDKIELMANYFGCEKSDLIEQKNLATENDSEMSKAKAALVKRVMQMSDAELQKLELLLQIVEAK